MSTPIHWFPGHMKKAQIEIENKLKLVDCVIELLDARIPVSSRNTVLYKMTANKARVVVLTKSDLADQKITSEWAKYYKQQGFAVVFANLNNKSDIKSIILAVENVGSEKHAKQISKGMKPQPIRAMVIGIPNVGKSTLINKLANRRAASVENKPGHTKSQQLIKVSDKFELLDTPGILQNSYEDSKNAMMLALTGSIKMDILPIDDVALFAYDFMVKNYLSSLLNRFGYLDKTDNANTAFTKIAHSRGYFSGGCEDTTKAMKVFLNELSNGQIGQISFERID